ncbi:MAG: hypothetical protein MI810_24880 [Flavobacteriales bacterium]|nr:hypothetical protein [Flavobacteriales bacterium]
MKKINLVGLILVIIGVICGAYCQYEYVPKVNAGLNNPDIFTPGEWLSYHQMRSTLGMIALFSGGVGLILGIFGIAKKIKMGWLTIILGIISVLFGLAQATHMFS